MAGLSDFGYTKRSNKQQLLSKLVCRVLNVQPGDDNHELALEFCLHNVEFHRFADVSPKAVDEEYDSLQARMGVNAQFGKQRALQQLRTLLMQHDLSKDTLDVHHRVLAALLALSRRPLQYHYTAPSFLSRPHPGNSLHAGEDEDAGSDLSELSAWEDEAAGSDELSDWSDDGADRIPAGPLAQQTDAACAVAANRSPPKPSWQRLSDSWEAGRAAKVKLQPPQPADSPAYGDGSLLRTLAATRGRGVPFIAPSARLFFTEQDLVFQVLHMLRGSPSPGRALTLKPDLDEYSVTAGAHVAHLSPGCLQNMLGRFTRSGTISYRLQMFVRAVRAAATTPSQTRALAAAPTLAAFAAALADELAAVQSALIGVQEDFAALVRQGGNSGADVGLIALEAAVQAAMRRLRLLEAVMSALDLGEQGAASAAGQAAALLDGLHALLHSLAGDATPQGRAEVAVLLRLLLRSARPLLDALDTWLQHGLLTDGPEFFICSAPEVSVEDADFWHGGAFRLRRGADESVICPRFLDPLVGGILSAGKSVLLLRMKQPQNNRSVHVSPNAEAGDSGRPPLHQDILQRLRDLVSFEEEESMTSFGPAQNLADRMAATSGYHLATSCSRLEAGTRAAERAADVFSAASGQAAAMQQPPGHADVIARPLRLPGERGWGLSSHLTADFDASGSSSGYAYSASSPSGLPTPSKNGLPAASPAQTTGPAARIYWSEDGSIAGAGVEQTWTKAEDGLGGRGIARGEQWAQSSLSQVSGEGARLGGRCDVSGVLGDVSNLTLGARRTIPIKQPKLDSTAGATTQARCTDDSKIPDSAKSAPLSADPSALSGTDPGLKDWYTRMLGAMCDPTGLLDPERCTASGPSGRTREDGFVPASVQATLINPFSGKAVQQMWGAKWKQHEAGDEPGEKWLSDLRDPDLPPVKIAIQECFLAPIHERVEYTGGQLLGSLMAEWGLRQQLTALQNVYLLVSPAMQPFTESLFALLAQKGDKPWEAAGPQLFELQGSLEQCLADERGGALLPAHAVILEVVSGEGPAVGSSKGNAVAALRQLRLRLRLPWPLSLVVQECHMEQYNDVTTLLLQVSWVRAALQGLRDIRSPAARGVDASDGLCWQMTHFATHLHCFVMDCLLHLAVPQLSQALEAARTLDDVAAAHDAFLEAAMRAAVVANDHTSLLVLKAVTKLLDLALRFADLAKGGAAEAGEVGEIGREWRDRHRYLMKLLNARSLHSGGFASLERLAVRLDYNGFYRSADAAAL